LPYKLNLHTEKRKRQKRVRTHKGQGIHHASKPAKGQTDTTQLKATITSFANNSAVPVREKERREAESYLKLPFPNTRVRFEQRYILSFLLLFFSETLRLDLGVLAVRFKDLSTDL